MNFWKFNETLINDAVSFEQPGNGIKFPSLLFRGQGTWAEKKIILTGPFIP